MTNLREQINSILSGAGSAPDDEAPARERPALRARRARAQAREPEPTFDYDDDEAFEAAMRAPVQRSRRRQRSEDEVERLAAAGRDVDVGERVDAARRSAERLRKWESQPHRDDEDDEMEDEQEPELQEPASPPAGPRGAYMPKAGTDDWCTPRIIIEGVDKVFVDGTDLDPCASLSSHNVVGAKVSYAIAAGQDGLVLDWLAPKYDLKLERPLNVYMNCPYGKGIEAWMDRLDDATRGSGYEAHGITLLSARTGTKWFHKHARLAAAVCFVQGRLFFGGATDPAPFDSLLTLHTDDLDVVDRFEMAFGVDKVVKGAKGKMRPIGLVTRRK